MGLDGERESRESVLSVRFDDDDDDDDDVHNVLNCFIVNLVI